MTVSVVIPSLVRESLYPLLEDLAHQVFDGEVECVLVCQPPGRLQRERLPDGLQIQVVEADLGLGFGHYRRLGSEAASGDILVWIDDDELPLDQYWLKQITSPIAAGQVQVVTAGTHIALGQGYLTDCISWLGFPGGAFPGFPVMWEVDENQLTRHLCSGNFAIATHTLAAVGGFASQYVDGNEDTELSDRLCKAGVDILYLASATVRHEARGDLRGFMHWQIQRGAAHRSFLKEQVDSVSSSSKIYGRLGSSLKILSMCAPSRYFPGVILMMSLQYVCQLLGYLRTRQLSLRD